MREWVYEQLNKGFALTPLPDQPSPQVVGVGAQSSGTLLSWNTQPGAPKQSWLMAELPDLPSSEIISLMKRLCAEAEKSRAG